MRPKPRGNLLVELFRIQQVKHTVRHVLSAALVEPRCQPAFVAPADRARATLPVSADAALTACDHVLVATDCPLDTFRERRP